MLLNFKTSGLLNQFLYFDTPLNNKNSASTTEPPMYYGIISICHQPANDKI